MAHAHFNSSKHAIPDYEFGDEVFYKEPRRVRDKGENDIAILVAMCLFSFVVLGGFVMVQVTPGMEFKLGSFFSTISNKPHPGYTLGNVKLGTTMDVLRAQQPQSEKSMSANGAITLAFDEGDSRYSVWYGEDGPYHIAYKARQHRVIKGISEDEYIGTIAKRYGAPSVATCSKRIVDGLRDCRFSWWMPGEVRLDLNSRQDTNALEPHLMVSLTTTDTRLEGRIMRAHLGTKVVSPN